MQILSVMRHLKSKIHEHRLNNEEHGGIVLTGKVKVLWLDDNGKRNEQIFDTREKARPLMEELNAKGMLWVLTDKF